MNIARSKSATRSSFTASADTQIATQSDNRPSLAIYNAGPSILYIGLGSTAVSSTNYTYLLYAGDIYIPNEEEIGLEHRGIFASAGSTAQVTIGA
jgi:hypothetical protein